jgi:transcriptional regulator with XRE-family HTH domain
MGQKSEDQVARDRLGAAIRQLRAARKLTRRELERATGLSYPYLSEIEAGKKSPSTRTLRTIADALGLEAHELLETAETGDPRTWTAPRRSHFHEAPATFGLIASSPPPESPPAQEDVLAPATERPPTRARLQIGQVEFEDDLFSQKPYGALSGGPPPQDPRRRLAQLVNQLSPEDVRLLIRLATRLRGTRPPRGDEPRKNT